VSKERRSSKDRRREDPEELLDEVRALRRELAQRRDDGIQEENTRYRAVVDNVVDGIITIDEAGRIESFNPAASRIFGYAADEVIGNNVSMLMPTPYKEAHDGYLEQYRRTGKGEVIGVGREVSGRRRDGSVFPLDLSIGEFIEDGRRRFTGVARDITKRKHLEEQLLQAQKMESVGQLAGGVAHDFNNQLGIILFDVDMLLGNVEEPAVREDLQKIRKTVLRAADLTRQLLVFSRRQRMKPQALDLNEHLHELRKMMARLLGEDVEIRLELADEQCTIEADPGNLDQVLINLCVNARDAMPDGGILRIATENVLVSEEDCRRTGHGVAGRFCRLTVADDGKGMDETVIARIFEPFFTTKDSGKGTGLGLAVVYGIIEGHGGWLAVESEPGRGARFEIYLPRHGAAPDEVKEDDTPEDGESGNGERILLIEDDRDLRERMSSILRKNRYAVTPCQDLATAGLEYRPGAFDLLLTDVVLPDGRGPDFCFPLLDEEPGLRMIILTGYTDGRVDWEEVRRRGCPVLRKPIGIADLLEHVQAQVESR
jgi:PAS domain S-box-containing protein